MSTDEQSEVLSFRHPIHEFLEIIRHIKSPNAEALPQRSNLYVKDADFESRMINKDAYAQLKDAFVEDKLRLSEDSTYPGIYFFFDSNNAAQMLFYVGKADILFKRLTKHFLTFDYFFYASAFPHNLSQYYFDCMRFYADGTYHD